MITNMENSLMVSCSTLTNNMDSIYMSLEITDESKNKYKKALYNQSIFDEKIKYVSVTDFCGNCINKNRESTNCSFINRHCVTETGRIILPILYYIKKGNVIYNMCSSCAKTCEPYFSTREKEIETGICLSDNQIELLNSFSDEDVTTEIIESVIYGSK
jgi:hypothetical protein